LTRLVWRALDVLALTTMVAVAAAAQIPEEYLDMFIAKVRPDKRAEFDAISKKVADANRRNNGDTWIAMDAEYGEWNTVSFVSTRRSYADAEKSLEARSTKPMAKPAPKDSGRISTTPSSAFVGSSADVAGI